MTNTIDCFEKSARVLPFLDTRIQTRCLFMLGPVNRHTSRRALSCFFKNTSNNFTQNFASEALMGRRNSRSVASDQWWARKEYALVKWANRILKCQTSKPMTALGTSVLSFLLTVQQLSTTNIRISWKVRCACRFLMPLIISMISSRHSVIVNRYKKGLNLWFHRKGMSGLTQAIARLDSLMIVTTVWTTWDFVLFALTTLAFLAALYVASNERIFPDYRKVTFWSWAQNMRTYL